MAVAGSLRRLPTRPKQPGASKGATTASRVRVPEVRIQSPPAESQQTFGSARDFRGHDGLTFGTQLGMNSRCTIGAARDSMDRAHSSE